MASMRSCIIILANSLKHSSSSQPEISRKPQVKLRPCVYPTCGKYRASFFNILSNLPTLFFLAKYGRSGKVLLTSFVIWGKQGWFIVIYYCQNLSSGSLLLLVMLSSVSHMARSFSVQLYRERTLPSSLPWMLHMSPQPPSCKEHWPIRII